MPSYHLDSSGLVKRYISETGTGWVRQVCAAGTASSIYIAQIAGVETVAAITRRIRQGKRRAVMARQRLRLSGINSSVTTHHHWCHRHAALAGDGFGGKARPTRL